MEEKEEEGAKHIGLFVKQFLYSVLKYSICYVYKYIKYEEEEEEEEELVGVEEKVPCQGLSILGSKECKSF